VSNEEEAINILKEKNKVLKNEVNKQNA